MASVSAPGPQDIDELVAVLDNAGCTAEDWTTHVRIVCQRCSTGTLHHEHTDQALTGGHEHLLGIAGTPDTVTPILDTWAQTPGRQIHHLDDPT